MNETLFSITLIKSLGSWFEWKKGRKVTIRVNVARNQLKSIELKGIQQISMNSGFLIALNTLDEKECFGKM